MLKTEFLGYTLNAPLTTASGTFGYGECYQDFFAVNELGMLTTKGITLEPRSGNASPRLAEVTGGIINSIGLENPGLKEFQAKIVPTFQAFQIPIVVNLNGKTIEEYETLAKAINNISTITFVELNISCPNVKEGGILFGTDPVITREIVKRVRRVLTKKKLIVKLSPSVTDIKQFALICQEEHADAISLINTIPAMQIDLKTKKPTLGNIIGGLSGPCIKPIAVRMVYEVASVVNIPIIGMGGVSSTNDVLEFLMAGARVVAVGTSLFTNPNLVREIKSGLLEYCQQHQLNNISEIVGIAHQKEGKNE
ncbi:dihydroorotate dehydrogenase 1B [Spiroplasma sp. NBRC 100390]|uniref:dihydroorotate dehydrogenase n=1 Tax=unclassified Spiroplasma TaxID=2637901 RepID=UPI000892933B|nr:MULTISPECIES: dihydroorotate dehydrogenase [unclassified Spiroplasma]AOX44022.1 dihydroorotate dehydrogenase 1B [Spiroplasma sp. TU-14]APE13492.1 dihydroorotate dehydrogenase 1B [Spiroplasma sp. NBRC 100390]